MTNTVALRSKIKQKGMKYKYLALMLKLSPYTLQLKIDNLNEFKVSEVETLVALLELDPDEKEHYFFCKSSGI